MSIPGFSHSANALLDINIELFIIFSLIEDLLIVGLHRFVFFQAMFKQKRHDVVFDSLVAATNLSVNVTVESQK